MKRQEELIRELTELVNATKEGKVRWNVEVQTTEANDPSEKPVEEENGTRWMIDECYVSYYCKYKNKDFCMISYELIKTAEERTVSSNMIFVPPLGVRLFDMHTLLPYSVQTSAVLLEHVHNLWVLLWDIYKSDPASVYFNVRQATLTIED